jgi:hypothetical protein
MKKFALLAASAMIVAGTAQAQNHTTNHVEYGHAGLQISLNNGQPQAGGLNNSPQGLDALFDYAQNGGTLYTPTGLATANNLGSRYRQNTSSPDNTEAASSSAGGTFTLQGKVSADCSFYNGSSSTHTLDLGTIGVRTGDNENVTVAFNQAGTATAHVDTATAGCNTANTVTIAEANAGAGLINRSPGAYDSAQFTAKIPYALNASWTGVNDSTTTGFAKTLSVPASSSGANSSTGGAWRSAFNMDVTVPPQSLGLVAGDYSDTITVTLTVN